MRYKKYIVFAISHWPEHPGGLEDIHGSWDALTEATKECETLRSFASNSYVVDRDTWEKIFVL